MTYEITVQLKPEVLDPEGRAIQETLKRLGLSRLRDVKVSKRFVIDVDGDNTDEMAEKIAAEYLANPVSETFEIKKIG